MKRKELSDGWRKALISAGAIDLVAGTTLEEFSRQEPGGLSPAPKKTTHHSMVKAHVCANDLLFMR